MASRIREILRTQQHAALRQVIVERWQTELLPKQLESIIAKAWPENGSKERKEWSDQTWMIWIKNRIDELTADESEEAEPEDLDFDEAEIRTRDYSFHYLDLDDFFAAEEESQLQGSVGGSDLLLAEFKRKGGARLLGKAPLASWLFARLERISPGLAEAVESEDDLGGWQICFRICADAKPVGLLFIEADSAEIAISVDAEDDQTAAAIRDQLVALLTAEPATVAVCELTIHAAELSHDNEYGWDGTQFLGTFNVSE